eukprot:Plantae.Rhodophyta-Purpureofilum_apyrenoidigerum.ctg8468.p1 GENE.Plantae.Rhodophyta-Purpureofilum_apyrenoidigerum.ctg8468~~Plantae.Rhodophyta-Purpureofilum_apyrenoidigerum.ctg8468.p1  ORF type:complete len:461 (-),score=127.02 Plantae.Rhodophyta-Purpureofilum_apyrenoidigerum.ctg8468:1081-2463(-)
MGRKKKPFIDRKSAVTYELVHRPKDEQTEENENSGMFLLRRAGKNTTDVPEVIDPETIGEVGEGENLDYNREDWELGEYGFPDDGHDYSQHLKESEGGVFVSANKTFEELEQSEEMQRMQELLHERRKNTDLDEVMALLESGSEADPELEEELDEYLQASEEDDNDPGKADDAADNRSFNEFEETLEDDFIVRANRGKVPQQSKATSQPKAIGASSNRSNKVETRESRVIDEQFDKLLEEYEDDYDNTDDDAELNLEPYSDDDAAVLPEQGDQMKINDLLEDAMNEFYDDMARMKLDEKGKEYARLENLAADPSEDDRRDLEVVLVKDDGGPQWDCETVLSTYSNLDNHPRVIGLPSRRDGQIKLDPRIKAPADYLMEKERATSTRKEPHSSRSKMVLDMIRNRGETAAEKKERKELVKTAKRERRLEKKDTRVAFRKEMARQGHEAAKKGAARATVLYD